MLFENNKIVALFRLCNVWAEKSDRSTHVVGKLLQSGVVKAFEHEINLC